MGLGSYSESERRSLMAAGGVIVLSIAAFIAFAYGAGILFWIVAIIAILLGFYMAYKISKEPKEEKTRRKRSK